MTGGCAGAALLGRSSLSGAARTASSAALSAMVLPGRELWACVRELGARARRWGGSGEPLSSHNLFFPCFSLDAAAGGGGQADAERGEVPACACSLSVRLHPQRARAAGARTAPLGEKQQRLSPPLAAQQRRGARSHGARRRGQRGGRQRVGAQQRGGARGRSAAVCAARAARRRRSSRPLHRACLRCAAPAALHPAAGAAAEFGITDCIQTVRPGDSVPRVRSPLPPRPRRAACAY